MSERLFLRSETSLCRCLIADITNLYSFDAIVILYISILRRCGLLTQFYEPVINFHLVITVVIITLLATVLIKIRVLKRGPHLLRWNVLYHLLPVPRVSLNILFPVRLSGPLTLSTRPPAPVNHNRSVKLFHL